jgi:hypothetical protein
VTKRLEKQNEMKHAYQVDEQFPKGSTEQYGPAE